MKSPPAGRHDGQRRRYFYTLTDGNQCIQDGNGKALPNDVQARDLVLSNPQDIVESLNPTILVTDQLGRAVYATSYNAALQSSSKRQLPSSSAGWPRREALLMQTEMLCHVGGWELDLKQRRLEWTDGAFSVFDLSLGVVPSYRTSLRFFTSRSRLLLTKAIATTIRYGEQFDIELKIISAAGIPKWIRIAGQCERVAGVAVRICGFVADISARKITQQAAWRLSNQDQLTGLANRGLFQKQLSDALDRAKANGRKMGLVLLDIDNLKVVNDTQGHLLGDALLKHVGTLLKSLIRHGDTVARIGGDEFAMILNDIDNEQSTVTFAESVQNRLSGPSDSTRYSQVTIGIAIYPNHNDDAEGLLKSADIALYAAKASGRGALRLFSPEMRLNLLKRVAALEHARSALREGGLVPFYQPFVALTSGAIVGFEALLRWDHPDRGILLPEVLQHALDDADLAAEIGVVMLQKVLINIRAWTEQGFQFGRIGINVTPLELSRTHFARTFLERVHAAGASADTLEIEVTENALAGRGSEIIAANLRELNAAGVTIALDDFGTGYGSLIHLRQMPISALKIDRAFVRDMKDEPHAKAIVRALINLAHSLDLKLVAEGVETPDQADFLLHEGCDIAQGFLFAPALPADQIVVLLAKQALGQPAGHSPSNYLQLGKGQPWSASQLAGEAPQSSLAFT